MSVSTRGRTHSRLALTAAKLTALRIFAACGKRGVPDKEGHGPAGTAEVRDVDPEVTPEHGESSGEDSADEIVGQHSASERSAEEHDLQEGLAGLSRLATHRLGLELSLIHIS